MSSKLKLLLCGRFYSVRLTHAQHPSPLISVSGFGSLQLQQHFSISSINGLTLVTYVNVTPE